MLIVRPARLDDFDAFMGFARQSGPGFTSLPDDTTLLASRLEKSITSFSSPAASLEGDGGIYLLMIEQAQGGQAFGCAAVKTNIGRDVPFFNYRIVTYGQASKAANRRFEMRALTMVNDYTGCTEVGTLFLEPERRGDGAGKLLSLSRFMLMATDPQRFQGIVVSELRGLVDLDGRSPFWEVVGRPFYRMDFEEADKISATTDNQFIIDLSPKHAIYVDLLPESARGAIGETHPDGAPARRLLEREGLRFEGVIDIFDGGPLLAARIEDTRTVRESQQLPFLVGNTHGEDRVMVSNDRVAGFTCTLAPGRITPDGVVLKNEVLEALEMDKGQIGRVRSFNV
ncbi:arginine N-succinyltransferase [Candidatus Phycosocius spiralis]|uniref:Arginine N-succinyltransferase n=1 Tax=Candidatus Phycosocius spiralis TaxID=2815099 RepID=A0ABQ4PUB2_9PROT|nr:arginine N-succinyltransferase [Candidatus Phycosocius spiralis]GIU66615.1 arginine N-succinyltransferase [Candidatus Phycosocius spiralis]